MAQQTLVGQCLLTFEASRSHSKHDTIGRTSDRPNAETSTSQNKTLKRETSMASIKIQNHNPNKRAAADPDFRAHSHSDQSAT